MIDGEHHGQSEVVIDPISPKSWSLSRTKQASAVKLEKNITLVKFFACLITHRTLAIGIFCGQCKFWYSFEI